MRRQGIRLDRSKFQSSSLSDSLVYSRCTHCKTPPLLSVSSSPPFKKIWWMWSLWKNRRQKLLTPPTIFLPNDVVTSLTRQTLFDTNAANYIPWLLEQAYISLETTRDTTKPNNCVMLLLRTSLLQNRTIFFLRCLPLPATTRQAYTRRGGSTKEKTPNRMLPVCCLRHFETWQGWKYAVVCLLLPGKSPRNFGLDPNILILSFDLAYTYRYWVEPVPVPVGHFSADLETLYYASIYQENGLTRL